MNMSFNIHSLFHFLFHTGNRQYESTLSIPNELENELAKLLKDKGEIGFAESCTGGYLSCLLTASTKLSDHFKGSIICYSPEIKTGILQVSEDVVKEQEAVNETCAIQMLQGLLRVVDCKYGVAITGFAGPNGGTAKNPVGTVYIAAGTGQKWITERHVFYKTRKENITVFAITALHTLKRFIEANN